MKKNKKSIKFPVDKLPLKFGRYEARTSEQNKKRLNRVTVMRSKVNSSPQPFCFGDGLICSHDDKHIKKK